VASPKKIVNQIEKTIEMANLIPDTLENELSACGRLLSEALQYKEGVALYVNFGFSECSIYLVDTSSSLIILSRTIKIGMELFVRDIKANLNWEEKKIYDLLKTIGLNKNGSYDIESIVTALVKELLQEIEKMIILARDKYAMKVDRLYIFNYDQQIALLGQKIHDYLSLPVVSLVLKDNLVTNSIAKSFANDMSSFIPVIAGTIR
jgi:Tfp pilus assembly PilM family ATPase